MCVEIGVMVWARGVAHREHGDHSSDTGSVEVQRLVERRRTLQSRKESTLYTMQGEMSGGRESRERRRVGRRRAT